MFPTPIDMANATSRADSEPEKQDTEIYVRGHIVSVDPLAEDFVLNDKRIPMYNVEYGLGQFAMKIVKPYTTGFQNRPLEPYLRNVSYSVEASQEKPLFLGTVKNSKGAILKGVSIIGRGRFNIDGNGAITVSEDSQITISAQGIGN